MSSENQPEPAAVLPEPAPPTHVGGSAELRTPVDGGLSALGLVMQLGGSVLAAYATLATFVVLFLSQLQGGKDMLWLFLLLGLSVARSLFHRLAGSELLYGRRVGFDEKPISPLRGIYRYIIIALGHTVLIVLVLKFKFGAPGKLVLGLGLGLAAWPLVLLGVLATQGFRRFTADLPVSEDKGFESAAILMTILGICGALVTGTALVTILEAGGKALQQGPGILLLLVLAMLLVRSVLHIQAGLSGLRETSVDQAVALANRYSNFGIISSFVAGGALLLLVMMVSMNMIGIVAVTGVVWMLMTWPMVIRRFFSDRQFADLLAGEEAGVHRRAPDAGLTGLGWLLLALAVFQGSVLIPQLLFGPDLFDSSGRMGKLDDMFLFGGQGIRSMWWSAGIVMLQAWAGLELIRMSPYHRIIASVFAVASIAVTIYVAWPIFSMWKSFGGRLGSDALKMLWPIAIALVIPIATLLLVNRRIAPTARARFRPRPAAGS
ncbi:MAG TPA: hypothetical protein VIU61_22775 [Kofleriaceae bacterium]